LFEDLEVFPIVFEEGSSDGVDPEENRPKTLTNAKK
jgi:hypothetical protein